MQLLEPSGQQPTNRLPLYALWAFQAAVVGLSLGNPFFWDAPLSSAHAQHWLADGPGYLILPATMDAGHPPLWGLWLAGFWRVFGTSLASAHLAVLPFLLLGGWGWWRISQIYVSSKLMWASVVFYALFPPLLAQSTGLGIDPALAGLAIALWAACAWNQKLWAMVLAAALVLMNQRAALLLPMMFMLGPSGRFAGGAGILMAAAWYGWHSLQTGWVLSHPASAWQGHRGLSEWSEIPQRIIATGYYMIWMAGAPAAIIMVYWRRLRTLPRAFLGGVAALLVTHIGAMLLLSNPISPRYLIVPGLAITIAALAVLKAGKPAALALALILAGAVVPHIIFFNPPTANAWDCTLAHLPYFEAEELMNEKLKDAGITPAEISARFPMRAPRRLTHLQKDSTELDFATLNGSTFVLYSNLSNDYSRDDLRAISRMNRVLTVKRYPFEISLMKKPYVQMPHTKLLILLRHGHSPDGSPDSTRPIDEEGMAEVKKSAEAIKSSGIMPDLIINSPATRTAMTAALAAEVLGHTGKTHEDSRLYYKTSPDYAAVISQADDDADVLMIVGHNPLISNFASDYLKGGHPEMRTGDAVVIELPIDHWADLEPGAGTLIPVEK